MHLSKKIHDTSAEVTLAGQFTFADNAVFREIMVLIQFNECKPLVLPVRL